MKKRILALMLVCCVVLGMVPAVSAAETGSGTLENGMTWELDDSGTLTVFGTGPMIDFEELDDVPWYEVRNYITQIVVEPGITTIGDYAFCACEYVTSVSLPEGITSIGENSFSECYSLTSIMLPKGLKSIGSHAFFANNSLSMLEIPASVTSIGTRAFSNCKGMLSMIVPEGVTEIGEHTFSWCTSLTEVTLPSTITAIGPNAFMSCFKLESITIPDGITVIDDSTFSQCSSLTEVEIPEGITSIGYSAFYNCTGLTTVSLPSTLTSIGDQAFGLCSSLTGFQVDGNNPNFANDNTGSLYSKDFATLYQIPGTAISFTIPETVTNVNYGAFWGCVNLTEIVIPDSVTTIGDWAFSDCDSLSQVVLPDSVTSLGQYAFAYADNLSNVTLSENLTTIPYRAFKGCPLLTQIPLPSNVQILDSGAFDGCTALAEITIPATVSVIDSYAFADCSALTEVHFLGDAPTFGRYSVFGSVTAICYYPVDNPSWNNETMQQYGGTLTWIAECEEDPDYQAPVVNPFSDVKDTDYFLQPVLWAVENGITSGTGNGNFSPSQTCTRGQVVTFLWRAAGKPAAESRANPFTDVKEGDYFYEAVLWAVENGITSGTSATTFSPNNPCTRGQVVTFLHRAMGKPEPAQQDNPFGDVLSGDYYFQPVLWAVENGITSGMGAGRFAPMEPCTRGQVVTFLFRAMADK